ncbi:MFS transporter [Nitrospirillum iridis]|uniref:ACS family hexuronate transporter-like MFS transporter n=1 Tax=Nitrospirillum iridis TaxID=765888 RepID=A0A7X0AVY1_9PROT|nr:MFS transporter [Nitrospirillum iridis]MBB6251122.1 ACS family hexuronate transporter-like MFS transporter [Nitrospirillum iridis]
MLALILGACILNYADRQIIALVKPLLSQELGWTDADYGRLTAVFQLAAACAFLFAGRFVDVVGVKWSNPLAVGSWSLAAMAHAFAVTLPQFLAARVALGATEALGTPTAVKTIAATFGPTGRTAALGFMNAAGSVGAILTPLVIPFLAQRVGWRAVFLMTGGLGLVWVALWLLVMRRGGLEAGTASASPIGPRAGQWREALADRRTWAIAGGKVLSDQVWWFLLYWAPDLFTRVFHLDMAGVAVPLALIYLAAAVGSLLGGTAYGWLVRRGGWDMNRARKTILLVCGLCVLPVPLVLAVGNLGAAVALLALTLAAHQGFSSNLFGIITDIVPPSRIGMVTGLGALSGNLAGMLILQVTGWVLAGGGGYLPMLALASVSYLLALGWIHLLQPVLRPAAGTYRPNDVSHRLTSS